MGAGSPTPEEIVCDASRDFLGALAQSFGKSADLQDQ